MTIYNDTYEYNAPGILYGGAVYQLDVGRTVCYHLNRLAGTLINDIPQYDEQGAAIIWAANNGLSSKEIAIPANLNALYALRNGGKNYAWDKQGALNGLAGT